MTRTDKGGSQQWTAVSPLLGLSQHCVAKICNASETAVHCCDPPLSVLVMLVSRNVFHVVSALQSIIFILYFWADQVSCRSYVGSAYRMRSLAVSHSFMYFRTVGLSDPIRCVLKHGTGHAVKCLGWFCPATFIFCFSRHLS